MKQRLLWAYPKIHTTRNAREWPSDRRKVIPDGAVGIHQRMRRKGNGGLMCKYIIFFLLFKSLEKIIEYTPTLIAAFTVVKGGNSPNVHGQMHKENVYPGHLGGQSVKASNS